MTPCLTACRRVIWEDISVCLSACLPDDRNGRAVVTEKTSQQLIAEFTPMKNLSTLYCSYGKNSSQNFIDSTKLPSFFHLVIAHLCAGYLRKPTYSQICQTFMLFHKSSQTNIRGTLHFRLIQCLQWSE